jgi:diguanylate cyclase (GGDEF)-like protein/PAS domain S-box-containing protein
MRRASEMGEPFDLEVPMITATGRSIWVRVIGEAQRENEQVTHVYGSLQDITARKQAEQALRQSERQLDSILDNAAEGIVVLSADGKIERINRQARKLFGYDLEDAVGRGFGDLVLEVGYEQGRQPEAFQSWLEQSVEDRREATGRRLDGSTFALELALSHIDVGAGPSKVAAVVRDITERKSWEDRISSMAYLDSLTGLPNRLLLNDRLDHAIAAAQRSRRSVGVLFLDLDHFKTINDTYGHHVGDQLLRELAERIRRCIREIDTVSRLGGDEFVIVLPDIRAQADAGNVARKILQALAQAYSIDGNEIVVTPTVGISLYPQDGTNADSLLRNADTAMYQAKESGKNRFGFFRATRES